eukprot:2332627-Pyramimonas_sp.AAC.1
MGDKCEPGAPQVRGHTPTRISTTTLRPTPPSHGCWEPGQSLGTVDRTSSDPVLLRDAKSLNINGADLSSVLRRERRINRGRRYTDDGTFKTTVQPLSPSECSPDEVGITERP